jgi:hypothetical protein
VASPVLRTSVVAAFAGHSRSSLRVHVDGLVQTHESRCITNSGTSDEEEWNH